MNTTSMDALLDGGDMDEWLWPESCAELRQIESSLRCLICGDFFHGPVMLPCTHTFCSECVRRFLQSRGANGCCPECKQPCAPRELVANRSLEKIGMLFQQMKPKLLPMLDTTKSARGPPDNNTTETKRKRAAAEPAAAVHGKGGDTKPPERVPLLSYNVMKDKEIKKLLEAIGIRASITKRDDIIQIHKEYGLLANAQADSSHPKPAKQIRDEVMRNYRARQQEKQVANGRKSLDSAASAVVTPAMEAGFHRLIQQVRVQRDKLNAKSENGNEHGEDAVDDEEEETAPGGDGGVWRHMYSLKLDQEFYIHSTTQEIRTAPPREFLARQQQQQRRELTESSEVAAPTRSGEAMGSPEVTEIASDNGDCDDDDDDFVMMVSPPSKPPLATGGSSSTRQSTAPSQSSPAARKRTAAQRRNSFGTSIGSSATASPVNPASTGDTRKGFFSQETATPCSLQETSTQYLPSPSPQVRVPADGHNRDRDNGDQDEVEAEDQDDDVATTQPSSTCSPSSKWECPRCTLVNDTPGLVECEACGYQHRPARKKPKMQLQQRKIFSSLTN